MKIQIASPKLYLYNIVLSMIFIENLFPKEEKESCQKDEMFMEFISKLFASDAF